MDMTLFASSASLVAVVAFASGWAIARLACRKRIGEKNRIIDELTLKKNEAEMRYVAATEKASALEEIKSQMTDTFKAVSAGALRENNSAFLDLAGSELSKYLEMAKKDFEIRDREIQSIVQPVKDSLERYDRQMQAMENTRQKAYGGLYQQVVSLARSQQELQKETGKLVSALRQPHVRGRWGETTLRRAAELAGMVNRCDFFEQASTRGENGLLRPDMVVRLPGGRQIVVDAKVSLAAYLDAVEAETEQEKALKMADHARQMETHVTGLSRKSYWSQFSPAPEFVVMFIPGENFFGAALNVNPDLLETAAAKGVIPATPTTLIALLKTVSFGWRQETAAENTKVISALGKELYERLLSIVGHIDRVGRELEKTSTAYNQLVGSMEKRVLVSARKFNDLGVSSEKKKNIPELTPVEMPVRKISGDM